MTCFTESDLKRLVNRGHKINAKPSAPKIPVANEGEDLFRFQCAALKLPPFEEQYLFAEPMQKSYRADFCWVAQKLIVEIQGGVWRKGGGAHSHPTKLISDMVRQQHAARLGFLFLPFTPDEVFSGHAVEWTKETLTERGWQP